MENERRTMANDNKKIPVAFRLQFSDIWENPELVFNPNMAAPWMKKVPEFIFARFPYVNALTFLMLLAERAGKLEKYPPIPPKLVYATVAMFVVIGVLLSAKIRRREAALVYAGQLAFLAYNIYTNPNYKYSYNERNRIGCRYLGCMGMFVLYAYLTNSRQSAMLQRIGEFLVSFCLGAIGYLLNSSYEDKRGFLQHVPGGDWSRYFFTLLFMCSAICYFSGYFLKDISMSVGILLGFLTVLVDCRFAYWQSRGILFWDQVRIVADDFCLMSGFFMLMQAYENLVGEEEVKEKDD